ncbi:hypothetical protein [Streptomyces werraensis]|uniref:hypothetical protein n=1 Tax=Streptomyces werraensis TaxID=68284 RepID=UPI0034270DC8
MQPRPHLIQLPDEQGRERTFVWHRPPGDGSDQLLGHVHETAGAGWVATWTDTDGNELIGMPGFATGDAAAEALYWFDPPLQSIRSREALEVPDTWVNGTVTFRAATVQEAVSTVIRTLGPLKSQEPDFKHASAHHNVHLRVRYPH